MTENKALEAMRKAINKTIQAYRNKKSTYDYTDEDAVELAEDCIMSIDELLNAEG